MDVRSRTFAALVAAGCLLLGCGDDDTGSADERGDVDTQIQDSGGGGGGGDETTDEGEEGSVEDEGTQSGGDGTGDSSGNDGDVESGG